MLLDKVMRERRSIRSFTADTPSDTLINKVLEAVRFVPSPVNSQPLELVAIKSEEKRSELKETLENEYRKLHDKILESGDRKRLKLLKSYWRFALSMFNAPVIIAAGIKEYKRITDTIFEDEKEIGNPGEIYLGASLYALSLSAQSEGLGTCIYTSPLSIAGKSKVLKDFPDFDISAFITLGYPNEEPEILVKKDLKDMVTYL